MASLSSAITGKTVAFDTAPLIYYIEEHPTYLTVADELYQSFDEGLAHGMTSVLTLLEVLVKPFREGRQTLADEYCDLLLHSAGIVPMPLDEKISVRAAELRAKCARLRTPDAIQIATAMEHGADFIVTNDDEWMGLTEIQILMLKHFV